MMSDKKKMPPEPPFNREAILDEAADWCVRLSDAEFDPDEPYPNLVNREEAFLTWVRKSPDHLGAFLKIYGAHERLSVLDSKRQKDIETLLVKVREEFGNDRPRVSETRGWEPLRGGRYSRPFHLYRAAAAVTVLAVAAYFGWFYLHPAPLNESLSTKVGEVQQYTLADGTGAALDTNSRIEVLYTRSNRRVDVIRGGAFFTVVHDKTRPFTTCVGGILVQDIGTEFAVQTSAAGAGVTVTSGAVRVIGTCGLRDSSKDRASAGKVLGAGEHADIGVLASGDLQIRTEPLTPRQMEVALSWRYGVLIFEHTTLGEAIPRITRYLPRGVVLGEPVLADVPFGGTISISVVERNFLSNLKYTYSIIPDPKRTTSTEVVLIPAPGHPLGGPY